MNANHIKKTEGLLYITIAQYIMKQHCNWYQQYRASSNATADWYLNRNILEKFKTLWHWENRPHNSHTSVESCCSQKEEYGHSDSHLGSLVGYRRCYSVSPNWVLCFCRSLAHLYFIFHHMLCMDRRLWYHCPSLPRGSWVAHPGHNTDVSLFRVWMPPIVGSSVRCPFIWGAGACLEGGGLVGRSFHVVKRKSNFLSGITFLYFYCVSLRLCSDAGYRPPQWDNSSIVHTDLMMSILVQSIPFLF